TPHLPTPPPNDLRRRDASRKARVCGKRASRPELDPERLRNRELNRLSRISHRKESGKRLAREDVPEVTVDGRKRRIAHGIRTPSRRRRSKRRPDVDPLPSRQRLVQGQMRFETCAMREEKLEGHVRARRPLRFLK